MTTRFEELARFLSGFVVSNWSDVTPAMPATNLEQRNLQVYTVPLTGLRVWDAFATNLPGTSATDDLGLVGGTFATASPTVQTHDGDSDSGITTYARFEFILPQNYVAGQTVKLRIHAGMKTNVADQSATLDVEAFRSDSEEGIGSDLYAGAALTINSLTMADKDFTIAAATLGPGDTLDVRLTVFVDDDATGAAVIGIIGKIERLCDTQGG